MPEVVDYVQKKVLPIPTRYPPVPKLSSRPHLRPEAKWACEDKTLHLAQRLCTVCVQYGHTGIPTYAMYILHRCVAIICYSHHWHYLSVIRASCKENGKERGVREVYILSWRKTTLKEEEPESKPKQNQRRSRVPTYTNNFLFLSINLHPSVYLAFPRPSIYCYPLTSMFNSRTSRTTSA